MTTQTIAEQQKKFVIKIDKSIERAIDSATRKKLVDAYMKLFTGFAWVNWTKKQSLGRAWQNALGQCEGFLKTKNKSNPAAKYLDKVSKAHKTYWSRVIMTNENSPNTINKTPDEIKRLQQYGQKQIREAMDTINLILARYNEYVEEMSATNTKSVEKQHGVQTIQNKPEHVAAQNTSQQPMQQQVVQPQVAEIQKPMQQQVVQPQVAEMQKPMQQQVVKPQVAEMQKPMQQQVVQPQVAEMQKPMQQQVVKPQVAEMQKPMQQQVVKPQVAEKQKPMQQQVVKPQVAEIQKPMQQQVVKPQVAEIQKPMQQQVVKPQQQITALKQPQQITPLNSASAQQVVKQRINLFIMAKYNQKAA